MLRRFALVIVPLLLAGLAGTAHAEDHEPTAPRAANAQAPEHLREAEREELSVQVGDQLVHVARRYGWVDEAREIQDLFLSGKRAEAISKVPDEYLDMATLAGDPGFVRERIAVYKEVGVSHLNINVVGDDPLKIFEQVKAWAE